VAGVYVQMIPGRESSVLSLALRVSRTCTHFPRGFHRLSAPFLEPNLFLNSVIGFGWRAMVLHLLGFKRRVFLTLRGLEDGSRSGREVKWIEAMVVLLSCLSFYIHCPFLEATTDCHCNCVCETRALMSHLLSTGFPETMVHLLDPSSSAQGLLIAVIVSVIVLRRSLTTGLWSF
jgi:hypothetical protein